MIGKPVTPNGWVVPSQIVGDLVTLPLTNMTLSGDSISFDEVCIEGIDIRDISALVWFDCNGKETDVIRRICEISTVKYELRKDCICLTPCFVFEGEQCPQSPEIDTMALLCDDPCQRWADLEYVCLQSGSGQILSGLSADGKSEQYQKLDKDLLQKKLEEAKAECLRCNPCFKPHLPRRQRSIAVGKFR